ncbi:MAG: hypothetical protein K0R38_5359 [Polyangiaceae bacterium]|jgi:hypothetical protein|nr:hypothetical protein [Polyangiaceae bacterium]
MARPPSPRELVRSLTACAESEDEVNQELEQLLVDHSSLLAEALGVGVERLLSLRQLAPDARRVRVRALVSEARRKRQVASASVAENLSLAAATMLSKLARWEESRLVLDAKIVLGTGLVGDRTRKYLRFAPDERAAVVIKREKLVEAARALKFADVECFLEPHALRFAWRGGVGGLALTSQQVDSRERDAVLHVVLTRPEPVRKVRAVPAARERASSWVADVFGDLSVF